MDDLARGRIDLWYLVRLRPSIIKIDLSMIRDIDVDPSKQSLVNGLKLLGEVLRAEVVAEGIEREGELEHLQHLGVQFGQGYLLGSPGPLETVVPGRAGNHRQRAGRGRLSGVRG
jgi:EAL domain-containing protein (putative c-di-GMP-specific phosphodiesterase class I)